MSVDGRRDRTVGGIEVADPPEISPCRASYAVAFSGASEKLSVSAETLPAPRYTRSSWAQTSAAARGRLRDAFGAAHRRPNRCKIQDQELKTEPLPCLINSAGLSTYPTRKSVRTTRATTVNHETLATCRRKATRSVRERRLDRGALGGPEGPLNQVITGSDQ